MKVFVFRELLDGAPWLVWHVAETEESSLGDSTTAQLELDFNVITDDHDKWFVCRDVRSGTTCTTEALTVGLTCKAILFLVYSLKGEPDATCGGEVGSYGFFPCENFSSPS